jgi:hypothetical protein
MKHKTMTRALGLTGLLKKASKCGSKICKTKTETTGIFFEIKAKFFSFLPYFSFFCVCACMYSCAFVILFLRSPGPGIAEERILVIFVLDPIKKKKEEISK